MKRGPAFAGIGYKKPAERVQAPPPPQVKSPGSDIVIGGLVHIPDFITAQEEKEIIQQIDKGVWILDLKRRVQHYGYKFDYDTHQLGDKMGPLPPYCDAIIAKIMKENLFPFVPDQLIINEYQPGQGIGPHTDERCFDTHIASLSLGSPCVMNLRKRREPAKKDILLKPRSLLVLSGEARYDWTHGIERNEHDIFDGEKIKRDRRISLTFRKVIK